MVGIYSYTGQSSIQPYERPCQKFWREPVDQPGIDR